MSPEFDLIRSFFAPLAPDKGAFGLQDDAALLPPSDYVVTKDMMIEGTHFRADDPLDLVARKLLRVNLSDLAAKGARPVGYFLACAWGAKAGREEVARFAKGLGEDQDAFRVTLWGGDTTRHRAAAAPATFCATFFGTPPRSGIVRRSGACVGDDLWLSGTVGDAGLGLAALQKREKFAKADKDALVARFHLPEPRVVLGGALAGVASASIDVSDGLVADAGHVAAASGLCLRIDLSRLPLSPATAAWAARQDDPVRARARLAALGDDYEILFAAPTSLRRAVEMAGKVSKTSVARIGDAVKGDGVVLVDGEGRRAEPEGEGWDHFTSGR